MNYGKTKKRLAASVLTAALAPALALGGTFFGATAEAQAAPKAGNCQVYQILASKDGDAGIPKNLEFMKAWLTDEPYDRYKSFKLLDKKSFKIKLGEESKVSFKAGHKMKLKLLGGDAKKLKYHLSLTKADGKTSIFGMDYSIEDSGLVIVDHKAEGRAGKFLWATHCVRDS